MDFQLDGATGPRRGLSSISFLVVFWRPLEIDYVFVTIVQMTAQQMMRADMDQPGG